MAWDSKVLNFGVLKTEGKYVKVYSDRSSYITLSVGEEVTNAAWAGGELNVTLKNGKVRRYKNRSSYITI